MKIILFLLLSLSLIISACDHNENKIDALEKISISALRNSSVALSNSSNKNYSTLRAKLVETIYGERVPYWNNKAQKLKDVTRESIDHLERMKLLNLFSYDSVTNLKNQYLINLKSIDSSISEIFRNEFDSFLKPPIIVLSSSLIFEKVKNDILYLELISSQYFNEQLGLMIKNYTTFSALLGQNTTHLRSGETLEITAGVGSYTVAANPRFIINGITVTPDSNARGTYKLKVSGKGKKSLPVRIQFTSQNGSPEFHDFNIDYFVDD